MEQLSNPNCTFEVNDHDLTVDNCSETDRNTNADFHNQKTINQKTLLPRREGWTTITQTPRKKKRPRDKERDKRRKDDKDRKKQDKDKTKKEDRRSSITSKIKNGIEKTKNKSLTDELPVEEQIQYLKSRISRRNKLLQIQSRMMYYATDSRCINHIVIVWKGINIVLSLFVLATMSEMYCHFDKMVMNGIEKSNSAKVLENFKLFVAYENRTEDQKVDLGGLVEDVSYYMIVTHMSYLILIFFFLLFIGHRFIFTYAVVTILSCIIVSVEATLTNVYLHKNSQRNYDAAELLATWVKDYTVKNKTYVVYDMISFWGDCCGIKNSDDFDPALGAKLIYNQVELAFPPTCVNKEQFGKTEQIILEDAETGYNGAGVDSELGCYKMLQVWLKSYTAYYILIVGITHLVDIFLMLLVYTVYLARLKDKNTTELELVRHKWALKELTTPPDILDVKLIDERSIWQKMYPYVLLIGFVFLPVAFFAYLLPSLSCSLVD